MKVSDELLAGLAQALSTHPGATMEELARAVGLSRASLFRRFASREELVELVCTQAARRYVEAVAGAEPERGEPRDGLHRLVAALAELAPAYGLLVLQQLDADVGKRLEAQVSETDELILSLVARGQERGDFRSDVTPAWSLLTIVWLVVAAADGVRGGALAPRDVERLLVTTVERALVSGAA